VWTRRCSNASFCKFDLSTDQKSLDMMYDVRSSFTFRLRHQLYHHLLNYPQLQSMNFLFETPSTTKFGIKLIVTMMICDRKYHKCAGRFNSLRCRHSLLVENHNMRFSLSRQVKSHGEIRKKSPTAVLLFLWDIVIIR
jgi:hypothetical protein